MPRGSSTCTTPTATSSAMSRSAMPSSLMISTECSPAAEGGDHGGVRGLRNPSNHWAARASGRPDARTRQRRPWRPRYRNTGTMSVAYMSVHRPSGYFVTKEGWEYVGFTGAASLAASVLGGGRLSVDRLLGLHAAGTPVTRAAVTAACGLAGPVIQPALFWRGPPPASRRGPRAQA